VIADGKRVVSIGYNGPPAHTRDDDLSREERHMRVVHAEVNAVLAAQGRTRGCTLYSTHPPCSHCMALIIQAGITRVVALSTPLSDRWAESVGEAARMAAEAGILYRLETTDEPT
jgi:deoxycytidylate deaminase